ncbi:uncharacterized protein LOC141693724 [Apium graveolens]|uniref:uncharacterized protein LOC141693724 n=1 Tax=Apium graveolens TaxID=4045 RepID=UPI003D7B3153
MYVNLNGFLFILCPKQGEDPSRKRGRSGSIITEDVLDLWSISRPSPDSHGTKRIIAEEATPAEEEPAEGACTNVVLCPGSASGGGITQVENNTVHNIGRPEETCSFCTGRVWAAEFTGRHVGTGPKGYSICCGKGKVQLSLLRETPPELNELIRFGGTGFNVFFSKSRVYNNIFAFCSFGGNIDHSINNRKRPYVFRVCGRTYHSLGSLVPPNGRTPKFAQLYMYDGQEAVDHRVNFTGKTGEVDPTIVSILQEMLERENASVDMFKQVRERFTGVQPEQVRLRLFERRTSDGRFQNLPTTNDYEFADLVVDNDFTSTGDVVDEHKTTGLQHINDLHPSFMSVQYPLLFPFGEDGYRINIKHRNADNSEHEKDTVSMPEYYAFRAQYRIGEGHTLLLGGRLFLQFIVDALCSVERSRLLWVHIHQSIIRSDLYNNIVDSLRRGDIDATEVGRRVILPSSFTGGYRYICVHGGVSEAGLPHAHIVLWLAAADKLLTPEDIDNVISAEIPDKIADPEGYKAVTQLMMHGPCGEANPKCPCMFNGRCTKLYLKPFSDNTIIDVDSYALYRRRDTKVTVECKNIQLEYIDKGPDTATTRLEKGPQQPPTKNAGSSTLKSSDSDEVNNYLSCRCVSAAEACWRLFEFPIHHREPFVQRLYFHLENEQEVRFRDNETLPEVVRMVDPDGTMFIQWMLKNRYDALGQDLTLLNTQQSSDGMELLNDGFAENKMLM